MSKVLDWGLICSRIAYYSSEQREKNTLNKTDAETKVKYLFAEPDLLLSEKWKQFQENFLKFYVSFIKLFTGAICL